jgi:hypothetical protein
MTSKKPNLDDTTIELMKKMLATPPKRHDEMKVGRPPRKKKGRSKGRAVSAKRRSAS